MKNLYVTNLSYLLDNQSLKEIFAPFGNVNSATVILDRTTGRSRGFGFVEMNDEDAQSAMNALNGKEVEGRALTVNVARPREPSGPGFSDARRERNQTAPSRRY